jgi:hypothetical protein
LFYALPGSLSQTPQISKAVNPGGMAVAPARLQGVAADQIETDQLKAFRGVTNVWAVDVTKHIRLAPARRAGTGATKELQIEIRFRPVVPLNGELVANLLDVLWLQAHEMSILGTIPTLDVLSIDIQDADLAE